MAMPLHSIDCASSSTVTEFSPFPFDQFELLSLHYSRLSVSFQLFSQLISTPHIFSQSRLYTFPYCSLDKPLAGQY
jgi:hypothetical protein